MQHPAIGHAHAKRPVTFREIRNLRELTLEGLARRYPQGTPASVTQQIDHELQLLAELQYEHFVLTVYDVVKFARAQNILCQGRGSAANSAVCYALGITEVDPARMSMLFERFVSRERDEPPDIDVDFEHQRREEVIQYRGGPPCSPYPILSRASWKNVLYSTATL